MSYILQKSWLVHMSFLEYASFPTPTLETITIHGALHSLVAELNRASSDINLVVFILDILLADMSDDDIQGI